jgi:hypothetical protein
MHARNALAFKAWALAAHTLAAHTLIHLPLTHLPLEVRHCGLISHLDAFVADVEHDEPPAAISFISNRLELSDSLIRKCKFVCCKILT